MNGLFGSSVQSTFIVIVKIEKKCSPKLCGVFYNEKCIKMCFHLFKISFSSIHPWGKMNKSCFKFIFIIAHGLKIQGTVRVSYVLIKKLLVVCSWCENFLGFIACRFIFFCKLSWGALLSPLLAPPPAYIFDSVICCRETWENLSTFWQIDDIYSTLFCFLKNIISYHQDQKYFFFILENQKTVKMKKIYKSSFFSFKGRWIENDNLSFYIFCLF